MARHSQKETQWKTFGLLKKQLDSLYPQDVGKFVGILHNRGHPPRYNTFCQLSHRYGRAFQMHMRIHKSRCNPFPAGINNFRVGRNLIIARSGSGYPVSKYHDIRFINFPCEHINQVSAFDHDISRKRAKRYINQLLF